MNESTTFKAQAHLLIDALPDDANWKMLASEVAILMDIEEGLADSEDGRLLDNDEVRRQYEGGE
jgi:predicted transcriptional regulator